MCLFKPNTYDPKERQLCSGYESSFPTCKVRVVRFYQNKCIATSNKCLTSSNKDTSSNNRFYQSSSSSPRPPPPRHHDCNCKLQISVGTTGPQRTTYNHTTQPCTNTQQYTIRNTQAQVTTTSRQTTSAITNTQSQHTHNDHKSITGTFVTGVLATLRREPRNTKLAIPNPRTHKHNRKPQSSRPWQHAPHHGTRFK